MPHRRRTRGASENCNGMKKTLRILALIAAFIITNLVSFMGGQLECMKTHTKPQATVDLIHSAIRVGWAGCDAGLSVEATIATVEDAVLTNNVSVTNK